MPTTSLEERFAALEASNTSLGADVQALTATLGILSEVQTEQREMARKNAEVSRRVRDVENEARERAARAQRVATRVAVAAAILLPLASLLVYYVLFSQLTGLLNQTRAERIKSCEARNSATMSNARREGRLAAVEPNPDVAKIHAESARELSAALVNCDLATRLVSQST